jgi:hypothetical protein
VALPLPLRLWAQEPTPFLAAYAVWSIAFTAMSGAEFFELFSRVGRGSDRWTLLTFAFMPLIPIGAYQLRKTARVLRAGYNIADLRLALRAWIAERQEALAFETAGGEPMWARVLRWLPLTFAASTAGFSVLNGETNHRYDGIVSTAAFGSMILGILSFLGMTGLGVPAIPPTMQRKTAGLVRSWLWNSHFGAWIAARLTPRNRSAVAVEFRPTEVALSIAVEELFDSLPTAYRESLGDVPEVAQRLTARVTRLRDEMEKLAPLASAEVESRLAQQLADVRADLTESVATMEKLRLDLLRLHGGLIDLRPMTTTLDAARSVIDGVRRLSEAQAELGMVSPLALESRTPTPA